ncbi:MAG: MoaD/ThiS family protein [Gemmatimonadaceae bacterium]|nr:MoaD/ThiS family protein [Gemmatimonadaceae bacterium]
MTVTALLFASYADALGRSSVSLTLPPGATVSDALDRLRELPGGSALPPSPLVAINLAFARTNVELSPGDELAVIPPVAGG